MSSAFAYAAYADAINLEKPLVFFVGSSLTYGYPWQERVIFSRVVAARASSWRVANLSYIGANMRGLLEYATCSLGRSIKPNILVVEIPLVNSIASLDSDKDVYKRQSNYWLSTIALRNPSPELRDSILAITNDSGLMVRPAWTLLNRLPMYQNCPAASLSVAEHLEASLINLPSGPLIALGVGV